MPEPVKDDHVTPEDRAYKDGYDLGYQRGRSAAWHEMACRECRVSWRSWWQRLRGKQQGMSPWREGLEQRYEEVRRYVEREDPDA